MTEPEKFCDAEYFSSYDDPDDCILEPGHDGPHRTWFAWEDSDGKQIGPVFIPIVSSPPAYEEPPRRFACVCAPRYRATVDVSAAPVVVATFACVGNQRVPRPCGPICTVALPSEATVVCAAFCAIGDRTGSRYSSGAGRGI